MDLRYWQAIVSRDQSYDGVFYYAVKSTIFIAARLVGRKHRN